MALNFSWNHPVHVIVDLLTFPKIEKDTVCQIYVHPTNRTSKEDVFALSESSNSFRLMDRRFLNETQIEK